MNRSVLTAAAVIVVGLGIAYYFLYWYNYNEAKDTMSLVMPKYMLTYAELTTGDIAQFTPEQEYTFANIKNKVLVAKSNNTSSLSNEDIGVKIMDAFIRAGYSYCNDVSKIGEALHCNDINQDHTKQDKFFNEKYNEIVAAASPNNPLAGLGKFFGFGSK
jgi:hypothetical protein